MNKVASSLRLGSRKCGDSSSTPGLGSGQLTSQECLRDATGCLAHAEGCAGQTAAGVEDWSQKATSSYQTVTSAGGLCCCPDLTQSLPWACCWAAMPKLSPRRPLAFRSSTLTEAISSSACPLGVSTGCGETRGQRSPAGHLLCHLRLFPLQLEDSSTCRLQPGVDVAPSSQSPRYNKHPTVGWAGRSP